MTAGEYLDQYIFKGKRHLVRVFVDTGHNIYYLNDDDPVPDLPNADIYMKVGRQGWEGNEA